MSGRHVHHCASSQQHFKRQHDVARRHGACLGECREERRADALASVGVCACSQEGSGNACVAACCRPVKRCEVCLADSCQGVCACGEEDGGGAAVAFSGSKVQCGEPIVIIRIWVGAHVQEQRHELDRVPCKLGSLPEVQV